MDPETHNPERGRAASSKFHVAKRIGLGVVLILGLYFLAAYLLAPLVWKTYESRRPAFEDSARVTETADKHPGDPLNVALVGTKAEIEHIMALAKWYPADPLGLKSDLKIATDSVLKKPYDKAPVSSLYLDGKKEDLAFEQPVGNDPRKRHHVRFWQTEETLSDGRAVWMGSATFDARVGLSHTTGQITHHIAPDVDTERDHLAAKLQQTGALADMYRVPGFHSVRKGRNGGGDPWQTDGELWVGFIAERSADAAK